MDNTQVEMSDTMDSSCYDVIVIGLGGVGAFALRALAALSPVASDGSEGRRPFRILGVEQYFPGHGNGSSHGKTRIYRHAYFEHANYVPLTKYSTREFFKLQKYYVDDAFDDGTPKLPFIQACGAVVVDSSKPGDRESVVQKCIDAAHLHDVPVQMLNSQELSLKYPQFIITPSMRGVLEPGAGMICPERAISYAIEDAKRLAKENSHTLDIITQTKVSSFSTASATFFPDHGMRLTEIITQSCGDEKADEKPAIKRFTAPKCIVTAGAWTSQLIPELANHISVTRQIQGWVDLSSSPKAADNMTQSPAWFVDRGCPDKLAMYGIPCNPFDAEEHCRSWHKVALHHRTVPVSDASQNSKMAVTDEEMAELENAVREWLKIDGLPKGDNDRLFVKTLPCMYSTTKDEHFIVDSVPNLESNVWYVAGLSGHGFKMAPALGKAVVDLAFSKDGKSSELPIDFLRFQRLKG